jgi:hypothetical protein
MPVNRMGIETEREPFDVLYGADALDLAVAVADQCSCGKIVARIDCRDELSGLLPGQIALAAEPRDTDGQQ